MNKKGQVNNTIGLIIAVVVALFIILIISFSALFTINIVKPLADVPTSTYNGESNILINNGTTYALVYTTSSNFVLIAKNRTHLGFDGLNDLINISHENTRGIYNVSAKNFTVSVFLNTTTQGLNQTIITKANKIQNKGWQILFDSGRIQMEIGNGTAWGRARFTGFVPSTNTIYHIGVRFNDTTQAQVAVADLFVNGVWNNTIAFPAGFHNVTDTNMNIQIGLNYSLDFDYNGTMDEVRLYNTSLTNANVDKLNDTGRIHFPNILGNGADGSLILYLSLNENLGSTAYDTSKWSNNGTIIGSSYQTDDKAYALTAADFNQTGSHFRLNNDTYAWSVLNATYNHGGVTNEFNNTAESYSTGIGNFFTSIPSLFKILGVILILALLGLFIGIVLAKFVFSDSSGGLS